MEPHEVVGQSHIAVHNSRFLLHHRMLHLERLEITPARLSLKVLRIKNDSQSYRLINITVQI